jgi:hypothetical protein
MARGDVRIFHEARANLIEGGWEAADAVWIAICDNTTAPTVSTATPALGDFTQVGTAGTYTSGGVSLGNIGSLTSQANGTVTFDSTVNPSWAQHASNDTDAYWGIIYNNTDASDSAIGYVDLGGPVDMSAGDLTITWNASGIFTISGS